jgi:hypothetical protein
MRGIKLQNRSQILDGLHREYGPEAPGNCPFRQDGPKKIFAKTKFLLDTIVPDMINGSLQSKNEP